MQLKTLLFHSYYEITTTTTGVCVCTEMQARYQPTAHTRFDVCLEEISHTNHGILIESLVKLLGAKTILLRVQLMLPLLFFYPC